MKQKKSTNFVWIIILFGYLIINPYLCSRYIYVFITFYWMRFNERQYILLIIKFLDNEKKVYLYSLRVRP